MANYLRNILKKLTIRLFNWLELEEQEEDFEPTHYPTDTNFVAKEDLFFAEPCDFTEPRETIEEPPSFDWTREIIEELYKTDLDTPHPERGDFLL